MTEPITDKTDYQQALEQLITLSEQMLSRLKTEFEVINTPTSQPVDTDTPEPEPSTWPQLSTEREQLINVVFNQVQSEYYNQHLPLINQIVALDTELTQQAEKNKLALKTSLLAIKKSQKAKKSYAKY